jgi:glucokinase
MIKIGIDLGGTNIRIGVVENGTVIRKVSESTRAGLPEEEVLNHLKRMITSVMHPDVEGIGIGVPSVVDVERGIVYNVVNIPSWKKVHLKTILEKEFHTPVMINNDCNCFALGEYHFGNNKIYKNIVCVTLGTGVGAGIIIDGKLHMGHNTGAGEIGSLPYLEHNYEYYCSSCFFTKEHQITGIEAFEKSRRGDKNMLELWNQIGVHIGNLMKAILFTYDPEAIILGGSISKAFDFFAGKMYESLKTFPYTETIERIKIIQSKEEDIALLGASTLN